MMERHGSGKIALFFPLCILTSIMVHFMVNFVQVSLYGHSLGSVLSYDILCHQNNLSSPFPMDWMYKEHGEDEEPVPDEKSNYFKHSSINQDDTLSVKSLSGEKKSMQQTSSEMEAEFSEEPSVLCPTLSSGYNFIAEHNSVNPSNQGDIFECISDSNDTFFEKTGALDKLESMNLGLPVAKEKCDGTNNKDEEIKKLREEVGFQFLLFLFFFMDFSTNFSLPKGEAS